MTVAAGEGRSTLWAADGVNRVWAYGFKILRDTHVRLDITDNDGVVLASLTSGFIVTGVGSDAGGTVTYPIAPEAALPVGFKVQIIRDVPASQEAEIGNQGGFHAQTHEDALDKLTMLVQQIISGGLRRVMVAPYRDGLIDMTLPAKAERALSLVAFDADGRPTVIRSLAEFDASVASVQEKLDAMQAMNDANAAAIAANKIYIDEVALATLQDRVRAESALGRIEALLGLAFQQDYGFVAGSATLFRDYGAASAPATVFKDWGML